MGTLIALFLIGGGIFTASKWLMKSAGTPGVMDAAGGLFGKLFRK